MLLRISDLLSSSSSLFSFSFLLFPFSSSSFFFSFPLLLTFSSSSLPFSSSSSFFSFSLLFPVSFSLFSSFTFLFSFFSLTGGIRGITAAVSQRFHYSYSFYISEPIIWRISAEYSAVLVKYSETIIYRAKKGIIFSILLKPVTEPLLLLLYFRIKRTALL